MTMEMAMSLHVPGVSDALSAPLLVIVVLIVLAVLIVAIFNFEFAICLLAFSFFFDNYLDKGISQFSIIRTLGLLALASWSLAWLLRRRTVILTTEMAILTGFGLAIAISTVVALDIRLSVVTSLRYLSYLSLFFLVVQAVAGNATRANRLIDACLFGASVAAVLGLVNLVSQPGGRASGPFEDPNDLGFMLATMVPLALYRVRTFQRAGTRLLGLLGLMLIIACTLATFSRSALVGLGASLIWLVATRRLRVRVALAPVALAIIVTAVALRWERDLLTAALEAKENIALENVDSRLAIWRVAYREWQTSPLIGIGVGNFEKRYPEFGVPPVDGAPTTHNAYLNVLAEIGLVGFTFFMVFLLASWRRLRSDAPADDETVRLLKTHAAASFVVAVVAALFLTQQFYSPIWLLAGIGAGLPSPTKNSPLEEVVS